jgi:uncharacterized protein (TIGR00251 family)
MREADGVLLLDIKVIPASAKSQLLGMQDGRLKVKIAAAPEHGKANACLCAFFAQLLSCAKKDIRIHSGEKSRLKTLAFALPVKEKLQKLVEGMEK